MGFRLITWEEVMRRKLSGPDVGHKTWWALVKELQGLLHQDSVSPLTRPDGSTATSSDDKAALLANPGKTCLEVDSCGSCPQEKISRSDPRHYRQTSLLSAMGKVFDKLSAETLWRHLNQHSLLSPNQFGFRPGHPTSDLRLLLSHAWQDTFDEGLGTLVVALDIAGAFDRVWCSGLLAKLRAKGIAGSLLRLLEDYLQRRTLQEAFNGRISKPARIRASVSRGSMLGPVLWNVYIDDLLHQLSAVEKYASFSYCRQDSQRAVAAVNKQLKAEGDWRKVW